MKVQMGTSSPLDVTQLSFLVAQIAHRGLFFLLNTFYTQKRNVKKNISCSVFHTQYQCRKIIFFSYFLMLSYSSICFCFVLFFLTVWLSLSLIQDSTMFFLKLLHTFGNASCCIRAVLRKTSSRR